MGCPKISYLLLLLRGSQVPTFGTESISLDVPSVKWGALKLATFFFATEGGHRCLHLALRVSLLTCQVFCPIH